jgi:general secretion pathway protein C
VRRIELGHALALLEGVSALLQRRFWIVKLAGVAVAAQFMGSTASAVIGLWLMRSADDETSVEASEDSDDEDDALDEEAPEPTVVMAARADGRASKREYAKRQLETYNPFCPNCTPTTAIATEPGSPPSAAAVATALPLRLNATMEAMDPARSLATIDDLERGIVGVYMTGDEIRPGVVLASVEHGRVLVHRGGAVERIDLGAPAPAAPAKNAEEKPAKKPAAKKPAKTDDRIECTNDAHCVVQRELVEEVFANPGAFASQAPRIMPAATGGFKMSSVKNGSLIKQLGFASGDTLLAVNGEELGGMDAVLGLATKLRRAASVTVTLDRKGKTIEKQIEIRG